jgi:hypothetical protein
LPYSVLGSQFVFTVTPKALNSTDAVAIGHKVSFVLLDQEIDLTLGCNIGISSPSIGKNNRAFLYLFEDLWLYLFGLSIVDQFRSGLVIAEQDHEY